MIFLFCLLILLVMISNNKLKMNFLYLISIFMISFLSFINMNKFTNEIMIMNLYNFFYNEQFMFGYDNLTLMLILLSSMLVFFCLLISWENMKFLETQFYLLLFLSLFFLMLIFSMQDFIFFYIFFELILMPIFLMMNLWGSSRESFSAAYYFFFFTLFGSFFMLISILTVYNEVGMTSILLLNLMSLKYQNWLFLGFTLGFIIKMPIIPFHIWLPQAHTEAPISGSILLAGILLKLGIYGFMSFGMLIFTDMNLLFLDFLIVLSILGMIYGSFLTISQMDMKSLMAYSSVAHMGFCSLGLFNLNYYSWVASMMLILSHGLVSSGLFISATILYDSFHSSIMSYYKGMVICMPLFSIFFFMLMLANVSFPGSLNFWGELMIFKGSINTKMGFFICLIMVFSLVLGIIYSFNLMNKMIFGFLNPFLIIMSDLNKSEFCLLFLMTILPWIMGMCPLWLVYAMKNFVLNCLILS